jgi:hypothetical protein
MVNGELLFLILFFKFIVHQILEIKSPQAPPFEKWRLGGIFG